jgi:hypothetical protein
MEGELNQKIKLKNKEKTIWKKFYFKFSNNKLEKLKEDKKTVLGKIEFDLETKIVEFIDYDNTFGIFLKNKPPLVLKAQFPEDVTQWIKILNASIEKIEIKEEIEFKTNVETRNSITPVVEYLKNSEKILFGLCSNYDSLR